MINIWRFIIGFCALPLNSRDLFGKKVDINIACYENLLDCNLNWQQREDVYNKLSSLYYYKYILQNVDSARVRILPPELECYENTIENDDNETNYWYIQEDF